MSNERRFHSARSSFVSFPTICNFKEKIDRMVNPKKSENNDELVEPFVPDYLTEMNCSDNPFGTITNLTTKELKQNDKTQRDFEYEKTQNYTVEETVTRDIRIAYNAKFELKKLMREFDKKEFVVNELQKKTSLKTILQETKTVRISNLDLLEDKRRICLLQLAINFKKDRLKMLDTIVGDEEKQIKLQYDALQKDSLENEQYLKTVCEETVVAVRQVEKVTEKKNKVFKKLKFARFTMDHLSAECAKLEEESLRLKSYKDFIILCKTRHNKTLRLEKSSVLNKIKSDVVLLEKEYKIKFHSDEFDEFENNNNIENKNTDNSNKSDLIYIENLENTPDQTDSALVNATNPSSFTSLKSGQLEKLKQMILSGFINANNDTEMSTISQALSSNKISTTDIYSMEDNSYDEIDGLNLTSSEEEKAEIEIFFLNPQELVDMICELESNNLSLIENVQEQEEICYHMRQKITKVRYQMDRRIEEIDKLISREKTRIEAIKFSIDWVHKSDIFFKNFEKIDRYCDMFYIQDLPIESIHELMAYLETKVELLYNSIFEEDDSITHKLVEMLSKIESCIDLLYIKLKFTDKILIVKAKKRVDERKIEAARLLQKTIGIEAQALKMKKAIENAKLPPRYRFGRRVVYRSDPVKKISKPNVEDLANIRQQQEHEWFFT